MEAPRFILRVRVVCWWLETWSATLHKSEKKRWEGIEELLPASSTKKKKEKGNIFIKPARLLSVDDLDAWGKKKKRKRKMWHNHVCAQHRMDQVVLCLSARLLACYMWL